MKIIKPTVKKESEEIVKEGKRDSITCTTNNDTIMITSISSTSLLTHETPHTQFLHKI